MPPKKKPVGSLKKTSTTTGSKSAGSKNGSVKGGKKGKKVARSEFEGPTDWKLSKDRLEMLKPENIPIASRIKAQVTEDLQHLTVPFPHRQPLKHWTLKSEVMSQSHLPIFETN
jgi:hypothetical protein